MILLNVEFVSVIACEAHTAIHLNTANLWDILVTSALTTVTRGAELREGLNNYSELVYAEVSGHFSCFKPNFCIRWCCLDISPSCGSP